MQLCVGMAVLGFLAQLVPGLWLELWKTLWLVLTPVLLVGGIIVGCFIVGRFRRRWRRWQAHTEPEPAARGFREDLTWVGLPPDIPKSAPVLHLSEPVSPPHSPALPSLRKVPATTKAILASEHSRAQLSAQLRQIDWYQFEKLVAAVYRARGYSVTRRGGAQPDGGVDLLAVQDGQTSVVQCKHWQSWQIKPNKVRELIGARAIEGAAHAVLITMRGFTFAARELARQQQVELVEETRLLNWIEELRFSPAWPEVIRALDATEKHCPRCEAPLIQRTTKQGKFAGEGFWGCSTFPRCSYLLKDRLASA